MLLMVIKLETSRECWPPTRHGRWMREAYEPGLVSVIVPTYNRARFVAEAMDSVFAQTYRPIELIVVDDGSTDNTAEVMEHWRNRHAEDSAFTLHYFREQNCGAPVARNLGLIECRGEFIQFLDSDDLLLPHKLEWAVAGIRHLAIPFVFFRHQLADDRGEPLPNRLGGSPYPSQGDDVTPLLWHTGGALYHRTVCFATGPWHEELRNCQDWEYGCRIKLFGYRGGYDPRTALLARQHNRGTIGVDGFYESYCRSAEMACDFVFRTAHILGYDKKCFLHRMRRRYIGLAFEYGKEGFVEHRIRCVKKAIGVKRDVTGIALAPLAAPLPRWLFLMAHKATRFRNRIVERQRARRIRHASES